MDSNSRVHFEILWQPPEFPDACVVRSRYVSATRGALHHDILVRSLEDARRLIDLFGGTRVTVREAGEPAWLIERWR